MMNTIHVHPGLVLRSPLLSFMDYSEAGLEAACRQPEFRSAILLASKSLYDELAKKAFQPSRLEKRQLNTLWKYFNRMCFRPTPFGWCAAFSFLHWENRPGPIVLGPINAHCQPSRGLELRLAEKIKQQLGHRLHIRTNPTVYRLGREYRFYRSTRTEGSSRLAFSLEQLLVTPLLVRIYKSCAKPVPLAIILESVIGFANCTVNEAQEFLQDLLDRQFLETEEDAGITGKGYLDRLLSSAERIPLYTRDEFSLQQIVRSSHTALPTIADYETITTGLEELQLSLPAANDLYYCVAERPVVEGGCPQHLAGDLLSAIDALDRLTVDPQHPTLDQFRRDFSSKYEDQRVPLLLALDPYAGIGYGLSPESAKGELPLETVPFEHSAQLPASTPWTPVHQLLMNRWNENAKGGIHLPEEDLLALPPNGRFPTGFPILFRQIAPGNVLIEEVGGPSAGTLIGRFSSFHEGILRTACELAQLEEAAHPDILFAEIVHHCDDHADNINRRETTRRYELPVLCQSGRPEEFRIALRDLHVEVKGKELRLYCDRLKRRVIPRLTTAFNYHRNDLPIFRFLCDLQFQGIKSGFSLHLAGLFPGLSHYPRVTYRNVVLHLAAWHLDAGRLKKLDDADDAILLRNMARLAQKIGLPDYFSLNEHDHQLVFHSANPHDIRLLLDSLPSGKTVILKEFLFPPEGDRAVKDDHDRPYIQQFSACVYRNSVVYQPIREGDRPRLAVRRKFAPGSEWLYLKIYCHPDQAGQILSKSIPSALRLLSDLRCWFFVRYNDPNPHLRLRIQLPADQTGAALTLLEEKLRADLVKGTVHRIQVDTYERELERYGNTRMADAEHFFCCSSELVMAWLKTQDENGTLMDQFTFALYTLHLLLEAFFPCADQRLSVVKASADHFLHEYSNPKVIRFRLDARYRQLRKPVEHVLADPDFLKKYRLGRKMKAVYVAVAAFAPVAVPHEHLRTSLVTDLLHMHLNRIFTSEPRKHELACYHLLYKYLLTQKKRVSKAMPAAEY